MASGLFARMPEKLVSIILLTWNGNRFIESCLDSVVSQNYPSLEMIVVDNGSEDGTAEKIRHLLESKCRMPWKLELFPRNTGFAYGMNRGIGLANGDYILTLNQDLVMDQNFVSNLVSEIETRAILPKGSVCGKILKWSIDTNTREKIIESAGHEIYTDRVVEGRGRNSPADAYSEPCSVFGVSAAAGLYSVEALDSVSCDGEYFDNTFFSYLEDIDLDYRLILR